MENNDNGNNQDNGNGNGNGNGNISNDPRFKNLKDMEDLTVDGLKAIFPDMQQGPMFSPNIDSGNPGVRLIANEGNLLDMLKVVYVENYEMADNVADALGECDEFLLDTQTGKPNIEVLQRVEWIKYKLAIYCSIKGRFADAYKQASTGVLTNAMSDGKGWSLLNLPLGGNPNQQTNSYKKDKGRP